MLKIFGNFFAFRLQIVPYRPLQQAAANIVDLQCTPPQKGRKRKKQQGDRAAVPVPRHPAQAQLAASNPQVSIS